MFALIGERRAAAEHEVAHGRGSPQLAISGVLFDPGSEVDRDARDVAVVVQFDLAGVETGADVAARLSAGATLVQGYTAFLYRGPFWARAINRELAK